MITFTKFKEKKTQSNCHFLHFLHKNNVQKFTQYVTIFDQIFQKFVCNPQIYELLGIRGYIRIFVKKEKFRMYDHFIQKSRKSTNVYTNEA